MPDGVAATPTIDYEHYAQLFAGLSGDELYQAIVDAPYHDDKKMTALLFLGFICIYIVNEDSGLIHLKAVSKTEMYRLAIDKFDFDASKYSLDFTENKDNTIVKAVAEEKITHTKDWATLNRGGTPVETVRLNQANSGIAYTVVRPLTKPLRGAMMYNYFQYPDQLGNPQEEFMQRYTELVSQRLIADL